MRHSRTGYLDGESVGRLLGRSVGVTVGCFDGGAVGFGAMNSLASVGAKLRRSSSGDTVGRTVGVKDGTLVGANVGVGLPVTSRVTVTGRRDEHTHVVTPLRGANAAPPESDDLRGSYSPLVNEMPPHSMSVLHKCCA